MSGQRLLMATRSQGKLRELRALFAGAGVEVLDLSEAGVPESEREAGIEVFETFEENAVAKARYFHRLTGIPTVGDDSGLEVFALGMAPGVRSKRWSGREDLSGVALDNANNAALVRALGAVPNPDRRARYVCAAAYVEGERELVRRGESVGRIVDSPRGAGGFGYDRYFLSDEIGRTFGEVDGAEKAEVSHRGRAFRSLLEAMNEVGGLRATRGSAALRRR